MARAGISSDGTKTAPKLDPRLAAQADFFGFDPSIYTQEDPQLNILQDIQEISAASGERQKKLIAKYANDDKWLNQLAALRGSADKADQASLDALTETITSYRDPALPQWRPDVTSEAANAKADPEAVRAQRQLLQKIMGQTDPTATAIERFEAEKYRQAEEQSNRSAREAVLSNMRARGVGGSGAELGATLDAQSNNARSRMLGDLGLQAQAQQRALGMIGAGADLSSTMRGQSFGEDFQTGQAADSVSMFNTQQQNQNRRFTYDAKVKAENDRIGRGATLFNAETGVTDSTYNRGQDGVEMGANKQRDILGAKLGVEQSTTGAEIQGKRDIFGFNEERRAEELSKPKDNGIFGLGIGPF